MSNEGINTYSKPKKRCFEEDFELLAKSFINNSNINKYQNSN